MFKPVAKNVSFPKLEESLLTFWEEQRIFQKTDEIRRGGLEYVFYDGPPGTNGVPHIGHMMQSALKDLWPRYKTMRGYHVIRRAGWDTHGLPIELTAEKELNLSSKRDILTYGVEKYIDYCRATVYRYMDSWEKAIHRIGRFLDLKDAYLTLSNEYIQSDWYLLKLAWERRLDPDRLELKGKNVSPRFLYKDYRILPYCARCGTALSNFEVADGYRDVKDMTLTAKFPVQGMPNHFFAAWTTTAWTLLSNVALALGPDIDYVALRRTADGENDKAREVIIMARARVEAYKPFLEPFEILWTKKGSELAGWKYHPLWDFQKDDKAHRVVVDDYVTTEDGTGIVHLALYGEDDFRIIRREGLPLVQNIDENGYGRSGIEPYSGRYFKDETLDIDIIKELFARGLLLSKEKYEHAYPFCYRCDNALMYFARPGWFLRTASFSQEMLKANSHINWQPSYIKDGRFGNWLENTIDWNVTRERYWGSPLPVWTCPQEGCAGEICVGSLEELRRLAGPEADKLLFNEKIGQIDLHKPLIDRVKIPCPKCSTPMTRENFVLDSWFNAGLMFIGQWGYPAAPGSREIFAKQYPAEFICEAVDQTRGWFYTLLATSTLFAICNDMPENQWSCYRNVICTELVLDEEGRKMSKSRGNVVDPMGLFNELGADATRWTFYSSNPWNVKRFSAHVVRDAIRDILLPIWNSYSFFVTYARVDGWTPPEQMPTPEHPLDRWLLGELTLLNREVTKSLEEYDVACAANACTRFIDQLTNWYIRRSRRRFWKSGDDQDKRCAYATLYKALTDFTLMLAPFLPFISEEIYQNLVRSINPAAPESVHLCNWPEPAVLEVDESLSHSMDLARRIVRSGRDLRQKRSIKVRQPLEQISVVATGEAAAGLSMVNELICEELNVRKVVILADDSQLVSLQAQPNFRALGRRFGKEVNKAAEQLRALSQDQVAALARGEEVSVAQLRFTQEDVVIERKPLENWAVSSEEGLTVALNLNLTPELKAEGIAREFVHLVQNLRKDADLNVIDKIVTSFTSQSDDIIKAIQLGSNWIRQETLSGSLQETPLEQMPNGYKTAEIDGEKVYYYIQNID
jgi:isoleucyl-tRNA synthetase